MFDGSIIQLYIEGLNKLKLNNLKNNLETVMIYDIKQKVKTYAEITYSIWKLFTHLTIKN